MRLTKLSLRAVFNVRDHRLRWVLDEVRWPCEVRLIDAPTMAGGVIVALADPTILIDGDLAVVFGLSRMRGTKKERGPIDIWNRRTTVLRRRDGEWRIVHDHQSYPMLMDGSQKAALDLKPE